MAVNVGVNVIEVDGRASPTIQGAPTSVAAFAGLTERGVPNLPVRVSGADEFRGCFGAPRADGYLAYAVTGFFLNGGREAFISRVAGAGSVAAATTLNNRQGAAAPALRVAAGFRGREDPGAWGNRLQLDVRDDPRGTTTLAADTIANATSARLNSLDGFAAGSVIRFASAAGVVHRRVIAVDPVTRSVTWDAAAPVVAVQTAATTVVTSGEFRLIVRYRPTDIADLAVVEDWRNLSMEPDAADYVVGRINHPFTGSGYITATDLSGSAPSGDENPAVLSNRALLGGAEVAPGAPDFAGDAATKTGLYAFDTAQVQLLAIPDAHALATAAGADARRAVVRAALDYCAARGDCMFVGAAPDRGAGVTTPRQLSDYTQTASAYLATVKTYAADFQAAKVYGALYAGWVRVVDAAGPGPAPARFVPPDGHVMGVYARTEQERGIFKAPAGLAAQLRGALDVAVTFTDAEHSDLVRTGYVNGIRPTPGAGIVVAASRTLSTDTRWWFVNVRLLFNFVKASLRDGLRFVRQEPHTEALRRNVTFNVVRPFLLGLWRQGAFGSDPADAVFSIKCDAENNPPAEVDLGNFRIEVFFYPVRPAETVLIIVGQQPSGATAREA